MEQRDTTLDNRISFLGMSAKLCVAKPKVKTLNSEAGSVPNATLRTSSSPPAAFIPGLFEKKNFPGFRYWMHGVCTGRYNSIKELPRRT